MAEMTTTEWLQLSKAERRSLWGRWTPEQRLSMFTQLAAITPGFSLPYPEDYNDPADSPLAFRELALAVDAALTNVRAGAAPAAHSHPEYAAAGHNHNGVYAPAAHSHGANEIRTVNLGTIGPGDEKISGPQSKAGDQNIGAVHVIAPSSTWLFPVCYLDSASQWRVKVRNATGGTTHSNVTVYVLLVRGA